MLDQIITITRRNRGTIVADTLGVAALMVVLMVCLHLPL